MANNENAQKHRYQEKVDKYKLAHIAAGGDGWAERYRAECLVLRASIIPPIEPVAKEIKS